MYQVALVAQRRKSVRACVSRAYFSRKSRVDSSVSDILEILSTLKVCWTQGP